MKTSKYNMKRSEDPIGDVAIKSQILPLVLNFLPTPLRSGNAKVKMLMRTKQQLVSQPGSWLPKFYLWMAWEPEHQRTLLDGRYIMAARRLFTSGVKRELA